MGRENGKGMHLLRCAYMKHIGVIEGDNRRCLKKSTFVMH